MSGKRDYGYAKIVEEHFPDELEIRLGSQKLRYRKRTWTIPDKTGKAVKRGLRYGENPGQEAALYELTEGKLTLGSITYIGAGEGLVSSLAESDIIQIGKHPSMNNLTDVDSALAILRYFSERPTVAIVKHNNPSGVAERETLAEAYKEANLADRVAAFGGVAVFNRKIDRQTASEIAKNYLEVVCAPDFGHGALVLLTARKNLRILRLPKMERLHEYARRRYLSFRSLIGGGLIVQSSPMLGISSADDFAAASCEKNGRLIKGNHRPTEREVKDMLFGWKVEQAVTSNSVIYVKNNATVAVGTGGQDRVGVAEMAAQKAYTKYADRLCFEKYEIPYWALEQKVRSGELPKEQKDEIDRKVQEDKGNLKGAVMVSDGFFPFRDTVDVAAKHGITAIIQPGGSIRDDEAIEACNENGIAMVFTGVRAFKH